MAQEPAAISILVSMRKILKAPVTHQSGLPALSLIYSVQWQGIFWHTLLPQAMGMSETEQKQLSLH